MNSNIQELSGMLSTSECFCLNQHASFPFTNLFIGDETLYLKSDVDRKIAKQELCPNLLKINFSEQLIINIVFRTTVRLNALSFSARGDGLTNLPPLLSVLNFMLPTLIRKRTNRDQIIYKHAKSWI